MTLTGPRGAAPLSEVRLAKPPRRLSAKLNGRKLRWPLDPFPRRKQQLRLGADDGLHFGRNSLQVLAVRRDGSFDIERRTVLVPRDRPLAGAGLDKGRGKMHGRNDGAGCRIPLAADMDGSSAKVHNDLGFAGLAGGVEPGAWQAPASGTPEPTRAVECSGVVILRARAAMSSGGPATGGRWACLPVTAPGEGSAADLRVGPGRFDASSGRNRSLSGL